MPTSTMMATFTNSRSFGPTALATLLSVGAHVLVFEAAVRHGNAAPPPDESTILPALYLYAHDRQPSIPREVQITIPKQVGKPDVTGDEAVLSVLDLTPEVRAPELAAGRPLAGPDETLFDSVFSAIAVDSEVVRTAESAAPVYPDELMRDGLEGLVEAEFVVDTTGRVDLGTVRILQSTHPAFQASVESALAGMQFRPAWKGWHRVRQLVQQRFAFRLYRPPADETSL